MVNAEQDVCHYTLLSSNIQVGTNSLTVVAKANNCLSSAAATLTLTKLYAPEGLARDGSTVSWGEVTDATRYLYTFAGQQYTTQQLSAELNVAALPAATYTFAVKAVGDDEQDILDSEFVSITLVRVAAPVLTYQDDTVSWDAVAGATAYSVYAGDELLYQGANTSYLVDDPLILSVRVVASNDISSAEATIDLQP